MSETKRAGSADEIRQQVRQGYSRVVETASSCCGGAATDADQVGRSLGYSDEELQAVPDGANLGLGCGNPTALDSLRPGEVVVDLGSGAGFDALLAARAVGPSGRVIGVDMTDAMLEKARENAREAGLSQVEFRKGEIEALPVETGSVDAILSNCVINLSPEKARVFREAWRVLRPGGRLMISDIVLERPLPAEIAESLDAYLGCVGGASLRDRYLETIREAGFEAIEISRESSFCAVVQASDPRVEEVAERLGCGPEEVWKLLEGVKSISFTARKAS